MKTYETFQNIQKCPLKCKDNFEKHNFLFFPCSKMLNINNHLTIISVS